MKKSIEFSVEAREKLLLGVSKLSRAVSATLGPSGRNVIIEQEMGNPTSTKDGVTVARSIELSDPIENIGAQLVKQASIRTGDQAGDGTTTSTLLAYHIYESGLHELAANKNSVEIKRGLDKASAKAIEFLEGLKKDVLQEEQLRQIATISANNDDTIGELITSAVAQVGRDGVITIEESRTGETYLETVEGLQLDKGYSSPYFVTDNSTMTAVLSNPLILIVDKKIHSAKDLLPIMEACSNKNRPLLVIAEEVGGEALSTLVVNKMRGILASCAVKAPGFGDRRKAALEDIAILTGGTVISPEKGMRLDRADEEWLGSARKVTVGKDTAIIIEGKGDEDKILERVNEIKTLIEGTVSPYEKEFLQDRLGKLVGGVAVIHVGGQTELELKEKKDRVDDALHATRAALQEGILPGGGVALYLASFHLPSALPLEALDHSDQVIGRDILVGALQRPFWQIIRNAGEDLDSFPDRPNAKDPWRGYDARHKTWVNMEEAGIIDPFKVTRLALENAVSIAGTMLVTECVVSNIQEKEKEPALSTGEWE